jgi:GAF domain-containing protein/anti-sigma regulatory factor (Ser/Thr protein kinase)
VREAGHETGGSTPGVHGEAGDLEARCRHLERSLDERTAELREALEHRAATAAVLGAVARSPGELQPVLDTICATAAGLCDGFDASILLREGDHLRLHAHHGPIPQDLVTKPIGRGWITGRAVADREPVHVVDLAAARDEFPEGFELHRRAGHRTGLAIPLLHQGEAVGAFMIRRLEVAPFSPRQIETLQTFADQAVIAIENARLLGEQREALARQTATAEVLRAINASPGDPAPVFATILEKAHALCGAAVGALRLYDGTHQRAVATRGYPAHLEAMLREPRRPSGRMLRLMEGARMQHSIDLREETGGWFDPLMAAFGVRTSLLVPLRDDGRFLGFITANRMEVRPFTEPEIALIESFAAQAVIAIENARLLEEVQARTRELEEALRQQTATSAILRAISTSSTDVQPVFEAIVRSAVDLCGGLFANVFRYDGRLVHFVATDNTDFGHVDLLKARYPMEPDRSQVSGRVLLTGSVVRLEDALADPDYDHRFPTAGGWRRMLGVPMPGRDGPLGAIIVGWRDPGPVPSAHEELLKQFADQAVIAIENARLLEEVQARTREVEEALERQTATSEVLSVISRSPSDIQPVLDTIVATARRLCRSDFAQVWLLGADARFHVAAIGGAPERLAAYLRHHPIRADPGTVVGRTAMTGRPVYIRDAVSDPTYTWKEAADLGEYRSNVGVPLLRQDQVVGVILVNHREIRAFSDGQVGLLQTFADQAVIAIENVRLVDELRERGEALARSVAQLRALGEVGRAVGASLDLPTVLSTILAHACELSDSGGGAIWGHERGRFALLATHGMTPQLESAVRALSDRIGTTVVGRCVTTRDAAQIADLDAERNYPLYDTMHAAGVRALLAVPLMVEDRVIGALVVRRMRTGAFDTATVDLLEAFAAQSALAIQNARLVGELQARSTALARSVEELQALGEIGRAVSASLELDAVLRTIIGNACRIAGAEGGIVYVFDATSERLVVAADLGVDPELSRFVQGLPLGSGGPLIARAALQGEPLQIEDVATADGYGVKEALLATGWRAVLAVPLLREGSIVGGLGLLRRKPGAFAPETVATMSTFGMQAALAIHNARLYDELALKSRQLEEASRHKSQFLANMSHELRTPLNAILGFTELIQDGVYGEPPEKIRTMLERVQANGRHLLGLINDVLDLSKIEAGQLQLRLDEYVLADIVRATHSATEALAREKGLTLRMMVPEDLPRGHGDAQRIAQVLLNLVGNAIKFTEAGSVEIRAAAVGEAFEVAVSDTGPGIAAADQDRIFEEFQQVDSTATRRKGGTGLGLAISRRIVEMHGGRIQVESEPGEGSTFRFTLPVRVEEVRAAERRAAE